MAGKRDWSKISKGCFHRNYFANVVGQDGTDVLQNIKF